MFASPCTPLSSTRRIPEHFVPPGRISLNTSYYDSSMTLPESSAMLSRAFIRGGISRLMLVVCAHYYRGRGAPSLVSHLSQG